MAFPNENQKLYMVTGKGGVGKSAVAAALAGSLAAKGKKTVLVELGEDSYFSRLYGKKIGYEPTLLSSNLWVACWSGETCLREYVRYLIKIKKIADLFFDNKVMHTFIQASPALKELAILGKITSGVRAWGPPMNYDCIVVDAFSTGHYMALLRAPKGMSELIESGPMGEQSRNIVSVLETEKICKHIIVTLAEELPVSEALELKMDLKVLLGNEPMVLCNRIYNCPLSDEEIRASTADTSTEGAKKFSEFLLQLLDRQQKQLNVLDEKLAIYQRLPLIFSADGRQVVQSLQEQMGGVCL